MSKFLTELVVEYEDDKRWKLCDDLVYESDVAGCIITVPKGFICDFASVPRLPFCYLLFGDKAHLPSVIHDFLYRHATVSRKTADQVFMEAMKVCGLWAWRRYPMYWGVRLFGGVCYA